MDGYSLTNCTYGPYNTYDNRSVDIMEQMGNIAEVQWLQLITMKEELISHMKESTVIEEPVNDDLNELSASIIQFMKDLQFQRNKMNEAEKKMKQVIKDTQKDIEVITTFIEFLSKISRQTDKDMEPLQSQIKTICDDIEKNSKMEPIKKEYIIEKQRYQQHMNILRLLNQMNVGSTCSICLQENVNSYFDPCGHTACLKCCDKNTEYNNDNCPLCRKHIISVRRLYFS